MTTEKNKIVSRRQLLGFGAIAPISGYITTGPHKGKKSNSKNRPAYKDERLYHGPMRIPDYVLEIAKKGICVRTRDRHTAIRVRVGEIAYLFRTLGVGCEYLGEILRCQDGRIRVHVWSLIEEPSARSSDDLIAYHAYGIDKRNEREEKLTELDELQDNIS